MIRDIRNFIEEHKRVSMQDLSIHFKMDKTALEPIIDRLEKDGYIRKESDEKCSGCTVASCGGVIYVAAPRHCAEGAS